MIAQRFNSFRTTIPLGGAAALAAVVALRWPPVSVAVVGALAPLAAASVVDVREQRLPDRLVAIALLPVLALVALTAFDARLDPVGPALAGAALLGGPLLALHLISPAAVGFGDVKAGAALGAAVGLVDPVLALWSLCVASGAAGSWGLARRRPTVPLGPPLVLAAAAVLAVAAALGVEAAAWR